MASGEIKVRQRRVNKNDHLFSSFCLYFSVSHRAHASTEGVTSFVGISVAGFSMRDEILAFQNLAHNPEQPVAVIIGGAKLSSKISVIAHLLPKIDKLLIGGAMVFTFYRAIGLEIGDSLLEESSVALCHTIIAEAAKHHVELILAEDVVVADRFRADSECQVVSKDEIPDGSIGLDIGPESVKTFERALQDCKTILWNGKDRATRLYPDYTVSKSLH